MKNSESNMRPHVSRHRPISAYAIVFLGIFSLVMFMFYAWFDEINDGTVKDTKTIVKLRAQTFEAALQMGEYFAGDFQGSPEDVLKGFDKIGTLYEELGECGISKIKFLNCCVLTDPATRASYESLGATLSVLKLSAYRRVMSPADAPEGTATDKDFDLAMQRFAQTSLSLQRAINLAFERSEDNESKVAYALGAVWLIITVASFLSIRAKERQQRLTAETYRLSKEKYRHLIKTTRTAFAVIDHEGRIRDLNDEFLGLVGAGNFDDIKGMKLTHWTVEPDTTTLADGLTALMAGAASSINGMELTVYRPDGSSIIAELNASTSEGGDNLGVFCMLEDITQKRHSEEEALRTRANLQAVITHSPLPVVGLGRYGEVTLWSPAAQRVFGWPSEEVMGRTLPMIQPEHIEEFRAALEEVIGGASVTGRDCEGLHREGAPLSLSFAASPLLDSTGKLVGSIVLFEDVSERKMVEERLLSAVKEKDILLQEIHHRVKNNMQIISSMLKLQSAHIADPAVQLILTESRNRIKAMALVHDKLYSSRDLAQIDIREYTALIAKNLQQSYSITLGGTRVNLSIEGIFFGVDMAIPYGLALNELLTNCYKHAFPDGKSGLISVKLVALAEDKSYMLTVSDDGVGLPEGLLESRKSDSFGLKLLRSIVESQLKGAIVSEPTGQGTVIKVTFKDIAYKRRV